VPWRSGLLQVIHIPKVKPTLKHRRFASLGEVVKKLCSASVQYLLESADLLGREPQKPCPGVSFSHTVVL
jgi:hypothetical protein